MGAAGRGERSPSWKHRMSEHRGEAAWGRPGPRAHEPRTETGVLSGQSPGAGLAQRSSPRRPSWGRRRTCPGSEGGGAALKPAGRVPASTLSTHPELQRTRSSVLQPQLTSAENTSLLFQSLHLWGLFRFGLE